MATDASSSDKTSTSEPRWIDPRLLAALIAMITVPSAAFLAVFVHVPQRILRAGVFVVGFLAPLVLLWRYGLDRPKNDKAGDKSPISNSTTTEQEKGSAVQENELTIALDHPITIDRPLKLIIRSKEEVPPKESEGGSGSGT